MVYGTLNLFALSVLLCRRRRCCCYFIILSFIFIVCSFGGEVGFREKKLFQGSSIGLKIQPQVINPSKLSSDFMNFTENFFLFSNLKVSFHIVKNSTCNTP